MNRHNNKSIETISESTDETYDTESSESLETYASMETNKQPDKHNNDIFFEDIDDTYVRSRYGKFYIIIMKENNYINTIKLCRDAHKYNKDKNRALKPFGHWRANTYTDELIHYFFHIILIRMNYSLCRMSKMN